MPAAESDLIQALIFREIQSLHRLSPRRIGRDRLRRQVVGEAGERGYETTAIVTSRGVPYRDRSVLCTSNIPDEFQPLTVSTVSQCLDATAVSIIRDLPYFIAITEC